LKALSNGAAIAIQNVEYAQRLVQEERIHSELTIAQQIQQACLPAPFAGHPDIHFEALNKPAKNVSGDFYDYFQVSDEEFVFIIGDVCGKGIPASIFMASSRNIIKSQAMSNPDPANVLPMTNQLIADEVQPGMFVTVFYGWYNIKTKRLRFTNAGHMPPLLLRSSTCCCSSLFNPNFPIGLFTTAEFYDAEIQLQKGDILILYTDGINEAENVDGQQFGTKRLIDAVLNCHMDSPKKYFDNIIEQLTLFTEGQDQKDDITMMIVQV
jgi:sigma-B regulation protein RsbU (phosphoserine phosphatase)